MERHLAPLLNKPIEAVTAPLLLEVITPLVKSKPPMARKVLANTSTIFAHAMAMGVVSANPVPSVKKIAPWPRAQVRHHAAVSLDDAPRVFQALAASQTASAAALQAVILTGARSGTVRQMTAEQVKGDLWMVPAEGMKSGEPYSYPLVPTAQAVIEHWTGFGGETVFANSRGRALTDVTLLATMRRYADATVHGWRSTLVDFARTRLAVEEEVIDYLLAHSQSEQRKAYARADLLERRKKVLVEWERFLTSEINGQNSKV